MSIYVAREGVTREGDYPGGFILPGGDGSGGGIPGGGTGNPDGTTNPLPPGFVNNDTFGYLWCKVSSDSKTFAALKTELDETVINQVYTTPKPAYLIEQSAIAWVPNYDTNSYDGAGGTAPSGFDGYFSANYSRYNNAGLIEIEEVNVIVSSTYPSARELLDITPGSSDVTAYVAGSCGVGALTLGDDSRRFTVETTEIGNVTTLGNGATITETETVSGHDYISNGEYYTVILHAKLNVGIENISGFCPRINLDYITEDGSSLSSILENRIEYLAGLNDTRHFYAKVYFLKSTYEGQTVTFNWELNFSDEPGPTALVIHKFTGRYIFGSELEDTDTEYDAKNIARAGIYLIDPANDNPDVSTTLNLTMVQKTSTTDFNVYYSYGLPYRWGDVLSLTKHGTYTTTTTSIDLSSIVPSGANAGKPLFIFVVHESDADETFTIESSSDGFDAIDEIRVVTDDGTSGTSSLEEGSFVNLILNGKEGYITSGTPVSGTQYKIISIDGGASFLASGAIDNEAGELFVANGTAPTWGTGGALYNQTPTHFQRLEVVDE